MRPNSRDYSGLAQSLIPMASHICQKIYPGGKVSGNHYCIGDVNGEPGKSFQINLKNGKWIDRADESVCGKDLISLWAARYGISNSEAFDELEKEFSTGTLRAYGDDRFAKSPDDSATRKITKPPNIDAPSCHHYKLGNPTDVYEYKDEDGSPLFWVSRYELEDGTKELRGWGWCAEEKRFVCKHWAVPRPIYNLDQIKKFPRKQVVIVEGEKAAEAAAVIFGGNVVVTTWPVGTNGVSRADWSAIENRNVIIWPDADEPGLKAAGILKKILQEQGCKVKVIIPDKEDGWDAADAKDEGWQWDDFKTWARSNIEGAIKEKTVSGTVNLDDTTRAESVLTVASWEALGIDITKTGKPSSGVDTARAILRNHSRYQGKLWYDEFYGTYLTTIDCKTPRQWTDADTADFMVFCVESVKIKAMKKMTAFDAVDTHAREFKRNDPVDWMNSLSWDNKSRLKEMFCLAFGASDTPYTQAVSKNFMIGMVARAMRPGCKNDTMVILEGKQGIRKSTALEIIAGPKWFDSLTITAGTLDFFQSLRGKLLIEIEELASFNKADANHIKSALSKRIDRYRASYGRIFEEHPRRCVFAGTTNDSIYLKDQTGGRRFWPIKCSNVDVEYLKDNREQLFAEAVKLFKDGETWHEVPAQDAELEQTRRRRVDPWEHPIREFLINKTSVTAFDILTAKLDLSIDKVDFRAQARVDSIMQSIEGWCDEMVTESGARRRIWQRSNFGNQEEAGF